MRDYSSSYAYIDQKFYYAHVAIMYEHPCWELRKKHDILSPWSLNKFSKNQLRGETLNKLNLSSWRLTFIKSFYVSLKRIMVPIRLHYPCFYQVFISLFSNGSVFSRRFSREKCPTLTEASFFLFFSSDYNLSDWATFLTIETTKTTTIRPSPVSGN